MKGSNFALLYINFKFQIYNILLIVLKRVNLFDIECVQAVGDDEGTYCGRAARIAYTNSFCVVPVSKGDQLCRM